MIQIDCIRNLTRVPILNQEELEEYAQAVVFYAFPEALLTPTPINLDRFIEMYLHLTVDYAHLSYDHKILGMTAFGNGIVKIIDKTVNKEKVIKVSEGTIIIEKDLIDNNKEHRFRFTAMHECCHWLLHRPIFEESNWAYYRNEYQNQQLVAKSASIDYNKRRRLRSDFEFMEWQADFLASSILMPKPALRVAILSYFKMHNIKPHQIISGRDELQDKLANSLVAYDGQVFNVSKSAAKIRLQKLTMIVNCTERAFRHC